MSEGLDPSNPFAAPVDARTSRALAGRSGGDFAADFEAFNAALLPATASVAPVVAAAPTAPTRLPSAEPRSPTNAPAPSIYNVSGEASIFVSKTAGSPYQLVSLIPSPPAARKPDAGSPEITNHLPVDRSAKIGLAPGLDSADPQCLSQPVYDDVRSQLDPSMMARLSSIPSPAPDEAEYVVPDELRPEADIQAAAKALFDENVQVASRPRKSSAGMKPAGHRISSRNVYDFLWPDGATSADSDPRLKYPLGTKVTRE